MDSWRQQQIAACLLQIWNNIKAYVRKLMFVFRVIQAKLYMALFSAIAVCCHLTQLLHYSKDHNRRASYHNIALENHNTIYYTYSKA